jgi:Rad3-related DNA helicase
MKVPYASLADKLVQAKSELIPGWYQADTANKIIQALGRGIRHKTDWCITYILDGCFMDLYYRDSSWMPPEFIGRMRMTQ